jgi:ABC-type sulfate transport system permease component
VAAWGASATSAAEGISLERWPAVLDAPRWTEIAAVTLVLLNVALPTAALVHSLRVPFSLPTMWTEFSPQVNGAIEVAALAALLAALAAFSAAGRWRRGMLVLAGASFLIGGQLLAIALIRIYNRGFLDLAEWAYDAWPVPVMAYMGRFGWLALVAGRGTWSRPWRELRDMAAVDGADVLLTAGYVVWPLAWPTLAAGALLVGALSLTEVPATVLLFPQNPQVLTPLLMTWVHMARFDPMIEASLLMMISVLAPVAVALGLIALGRRVGAWRGAPAEAAPGEPPRRIRLHGVVGLVALALVAGTSGCSRSTPEKIWCESGTGPGQVVYPRGITHDRFDDSFFVVDRMARVQHLAHDGSFLCSWSMPAKRVGKPVGISVGPDGNVYVPDTHYQRVIVYSPAGKEIRRWGSAGTGDGQFIYPTDVEFDSRGYVFVSEYGDNDRIQVFDHFGKFLFKFGSFGQGDGQFSRPQDMVIVGKLIYLTDACNHRIDVFTTDGKWVRNFGSCGSGLGQFRFPYGMDINSRGQLVVSEFGNNRVQLVDKETGRGLKVWGYPGREPGQLAYPWGVAVDNSDHVVAVDAGNNRLQVFEF